MDGMGQQLLAGASLAQQQHRAARLRCTARLALDLDRSGTGPDDTGKRVFRGPQAGAALTTQAQALGGHVLSLAQLHEASMRKIDRQNASFWAAVNTKTGEDALGLLERQRVKSWLKNAYVSFDHLPLA